MDNINVKTNKQNDTHSHTSRTTYKVKYISK